MLVSVARLIYSGLAHLGVRSLTLYTSVCVSSAHAKIIRCYEDLATIDSAPSCDLVPV